MVRVREGVGFVSMNWFRSDNNDSASGVKRRTGLVGFSESQRNGTNFHHDQARWGPKRLVGEIINRFEKKGFSLKGLKLMTVDRPFAQKHYEDLLSKPFFGALIGYITSGHVIAMIWEGEGVVKTGRTIIGATNPTQSAPGTIRGDFAIVMGRNIIHGSDSIESAQKEIVLWFSDGPINWQSNLDPWIYE